MPEHGYIEKSVKASKWIACLLCLGGSGSVRGGLDKKFWDFRQNLGPKQLLKSHYLIEGIIMKVNRGQKSLRRPRYENATYTYVNYVNVGFNSICSCSCNNYRS